MRRRLPLGAALLLTACAANLAAGPIGEPHGSWRQQDQAIPITSGDGTQTMLAGRLCRPSSDAPAPLVVIAHGSPPSAATRPTMHPPACRTEAARWFLTRGFAVLFAMRRGYGATGGPYYESSSPCTPDNYAHAARETARDLRAEIDYAAKLPFIRPNGVTVVGQSAGGWGTIGLDSLGDDRVTAYVSMAGGRGGHQGGIPNRNCHPENLIAAAATLAHTATAPMLWIYTQNDTYFRPDIAQPLHEAFAAAGGQAEFHLLPPYGNDGHNLFFGRGGSALWGPLVEAYLRQRHLL